MVLLQCPLDDLAILRSAAGRELHDLNEQKLEILQQRLEARGKDSPEVIGRRVATARNELEHAAEFQYIIVNQEFTEACEQLLSIADAARCRFPQQAASRPALFKALGILPA